MGFEGGEDCGEGFEGFGFGGVGGCEVDCFCGGHVD